MSRSSFNFKRFVVEQSSSAMKVGTDGILLGSWCRVESDMQRALDVGSGTGLIALMIAQRGEQWGLNIDAVEIDDASARQSKINVDNSPWSDYIKIHEGSIQEFVEQRVGERQTDRELGENNQYDLIVSNPPYFTDSLRPPNEARTIARHTTALAYEELIDLTKRLLSKEGLFALILPYEQVEHFVTVADSGELKLVRRTDVLSTPKRPPKRSLLEFAHLESLRCKRAMHPTVERLVIESIHGRYSDEYKQLTQDFYLAH